MTNSKKSAAFTFVELMVSIVLMVSLATLANEVFLHFFEASRRFATMSYSNQEIENLRTAIARDMRAAVEFERSNNHRRLTIICALDEAGLKRDPNNPSKQSLQATSEESERALDVFVHNPADVPTITKADGIENKASNSPPLGGYIDEFGDFHPSDPDSSGTNLIYYRVIYEYKKEKIYAGAISGFKTGVLHPGGVMSIMEGVIYRTGPFPNPKTGNVDYASVDDWDPNNPISVAVSRGWWDVDSMGLPGSGTNVSFWNNEEKNVFSYASGQRKIITEPESTKESAKAIRIVLGKREAFRSPSGADRDNSQVMSTLISARTKR